MLFDKYPYTDFHEMNLDFILKLAKESMGLHFAVNGNNLLLKNAQNETVSSVVVSYAAKALKDNEGNEISTYILDADTSGDLVVFTKGDGSTVSLTVPYAQVATNDEEGNALTDYVLSLTVSGDKLKIVKGDGLSAEITVPFATKASTDVNSKDITTYAAALSAENDKVVLRDSQGRLLNSITVPFATAASEDSSGNVFETAYAASLTTGTTTVILKSKDGTTLSTVTVPYSEHAGNAIESVSINGDQLVFTKYNGQTVTLTVPYATKAQKDDLGNVIKTTYVADVVNNTTTGKLSFYDATGTLIKEITPTVDKAAKDSLGNVLYNYIKAITVASGSNYLTVTHGDGDTDSVLVPYADNAWKDTNGNVIKNTYVKDVDIVESPAASGVYYLVFYNGDTPQAELFRIKLVTVSYNSTTEDLSITFGGI